MAGQGPPVADGPSAITDEDFSSGRTAIRIASVAALGGLLFGYDSAVINGANRRPSSKLLRHRRSTNLAFAVASALLGAAAVGAMTAGRIADKHRPHLGDEDRGAVLLHQRDRHGAVARRLGNRRSSESSAASESASPRSSHRPTSRRRRRLRIQRPARFAAAAGHRLGHLLVVRNQLRVLQHDGRWRCKERPVAGIGGLAVDVPGDGMVPADRLRDCWRSRSPSRRGISLQVTRFRKPGKCAQRCFSGEKNLEITIDRIKETLEREDKPSWRDMKQAGRQLPRHLRHRVGGPWTVDLPAVRRHQRDLLLLQRAVAGGRILRAPTSPPSITVITSVDQRGSPP